MKNGTLPADADAKELKIFAAGAATWHAEEAAFNFRVAREMPRLAAIHSFPAGDLLPPVPRGFPQRMCLRKLGIEL